MLDDLQSYRRAVAEEQHDTYGFPRVCGMPPIVYQTTKLPVSMKECDEMLAELYFMIGDISAQIETAKLAWKLGEIRAESPVDEERLEWRIHAIHKRRILRQQACLLKKWKEAHEQPKEVRLDQLDKSINQILEELETLKSSNKVINTRINDFNARLKAEKDHRVKLEEDNTYFRSFMLRAMWTLVSKFKLRELELALSFVPNTILHNPAWGRLLNPMREKRKEQGIVS